MTLRVRFAPSPTGYLHVGGARTALFNWLLARREGGVFVLRVEDTDRARSSDEHTRAILDGMRWLGIDWDEGPVFQSDGVERHRGDALRLLASGMAYRDFTTPQELAELRERDPARVVRYPRERAVALGEAETRRRAETGEPHAIRFLVPEGETVWRDRVHGETRFRNDEIEDLVILRSDGTPTYNLAVVSDDAEGRITLVIRGDDHLSNTPKQILLHEALGNPVPEFAHVPMILGPDGKRLSKRHGATAVGEYRGRGILPGAMLNFLALLGWNPGTEDEVFTAEELCEIFSLDRVQRKSAIFDTTKLEWLNGRHLARRSAEDLVPEVAALLDGVSPVERARLDADGGAWFSNLVDLLKGRARTVTEIADMARIYTRDDIVVEAGAAERHWWKDPEAPAGHLTAILEALEEVEGWNEAVLEEVIRGVAAVRGVGAGKIIHPLRVALTGREASPGIFEVLVVLGRERALDRIRVGIDRIGRGRDAGGRHEDPV